MLNIDSKSIVFVTGKGGVGKSAVASSLALSQAKKGRKVLLLELGNKSFLKDFLAISQPISYEPIVVNPPNLSLALLDGESCLREYFHYVLKVEAISKLSVTAHGTPSHLANLQSHLRSS